MTGRSGSKAVARAPLSAYAFISQPGWIRSPPRSAPTEALVERQRLRVNAVVWLDRLYDMAQLVHDRFDASRVAGHVLGEHPVTVENFVGRHALESLPRSPQRS
jgi:hypothetical protein